MWSSEESKRNIENKLTDANEGVGNQYLYRESRNVSHSDTILDMAICNTDPIRVAEIQNRSEFSRNNMEDTISGQLLITTSRDNTIKIW